MFIVSLEYQKELADVDLHIEDHIKYLKKYYALGKFIASGRKVPRTGGVILVNTSSRNELELILKEDPFNISGVASYEIIEFIPSMTADGFEKMADFI